MTKERILKMIDKILDLSDYDTTWRVLPTINKILTLYHEIEEEDLPENNLVEFVGEDEDGNWIYKIK